MMTSQFFKRCSVLVSTHRSSGGGIGRQRALSALFAALGGIGLNAGQAHSPCRPWPPVPPRCRRSHRQQPPAEVAHPGSPRCGFNRCTGLIAVSATSDRFGSLRGTLCLVYPPFQSGTAEAVSEAVSGDGRRAPAVWKASVMAGLRVVVGLSLLDRRPEAMSPPMREYHRPAGRFPAGSGHRDLSGRPGLCRAEAAAPEPAPAPVRHG